MELEPLKGLPPREPTGSMQNLLRLYMIPYLVKGVEPKEAKLLALLDMVKKAVAIMNYCDKEAKEG